MPSRRRRSATSSVLNPNLTPLLDVVLQLITFFMMLVHFGTRLEGATKAVRLPVAPAALPGLRSDVRPAGVAMDAQGRLLVEGRSTRRAGRIGVVGRPGQNPPRRPRDAGTSKPRAMTTLPTVVILRADRAASYGAVRRTLAEAQDKGFAHFSLVVLRSRGR